MNNGSVLKTITIVNASNGLFLAATSSANARISCASENALVFHQCANADGTVRFQLVDRALVDRELFLGYGHCTGALKLRCRDRAQTYRLAEDNGHHTLESVVRRGMYLCMRKGEAPYMKQGADLQSKNAQWIFEESNFVVQPIFAFGHMCNELKYVQESLEHDGNAIECDIEVINPQERTGAYDFLVTHSECAPSYGGGKTPLKEYLAGLVKYMPRLTAVMFDCKRADDVDYIKYGDELAQAIVESGIPSERCIISVPTQECKAMLSATTVMEHGFLRDVSMIDIQPFGKEASNWLNTAEEMNCNWLGMGITNFAPLPTQMWLRPLEYTVNNKGRNEKVRKVYFWTLDSAADMRKVLAAGVDGVICNITANLHDGLPNLKRIVDRDLTRRMATISDSLVDSFAIRNT